MGGGLRGRSGGVVSPAGEPGLDTGGIGGFEVAGDGSVDGEPGGVHRVGIAGGCGGWLGGGWLGGT